MSDTKKQIQKDQKPPRKINAPNIQLHRSQSNFRKSNLKEKSLKKVQGENSLPIEDQRQEVHLISLKKSCKQRENALKYLKN